jgi:hypothetical protein
MIPPNSRTGKVVAFATQDPSVLAGSASATFAVTSTSASTFMVRPNAGLASGEGGVEISPGLAAAKFGLQKLISGSHNVQRRQSSSSRAPPRMGVNPHAVALALAAGPRRALHDLIMLALAVNPGRTPPSTRWPSTTTRAHLAIAARQASPGYRADAGEIGMLR